MKVKHLLTASPPTQTPARCVLSLRLPCLISVFLILTLTLGRTLMLTAVLCVHRSLSSLTIGTINNKISRSKARAGMHVSGR